MPDISTVTGEENISPCATKTMAYVITQGRASSLAKSPLAERRGGGLVHSAVEGKKADIVGKWTSACYSVNDGTILAFRGLRANASGVDRTRIFFMRVRSKAAYRRVSIALSGAGSRRFSVVEGRFDMLTMEDVLAEVGRLPPLFVQLAAESAGGWGRVVEIEPEIAKAPVYKFKTVTVDGAPRPVKVATRRRKLSV